MGEWQESVGCECWGLSGRAECSRVHARQSYLKKQAGEEVVVVRGWAGRCVLAGVVLCGLLRVAQLLVQGVGLAHQGQGGAGDNGLWCDLCVSAVV
ncbi:hypothetical protein E2C01_088806 [Portunus trituberculatus]|uniref:Uncharacterized protein n=1 Tax=Portunus trituberculatus TaxID=210409 RepID=A0A5B7JKV8_PORTR|nr:hypothetical protein [Portunus trituberculatus]